MLEVAKQETIDGSSLQKWIESCFAENVLVILLSYLLCSPKRVVIELSGLESKSLGGTSSES